MVAGSMPACHDDDSDDDSSDHEDRSSSSSWSESRGSDMSDLTADSALKQAIRFLNRQGDASPDEQPSSDSTSCPIPSMVMYNVTTSLTDNDDNDDDEHEWTTTMIGPATPYSQSNSNTTCRASSLVVSSTSLLTTTTTTTCNNKRMIRTPPSLSTKMRIQRTADHNSVSSDEGTPRPVTPTGSWYSNHIKTTTTILPSSSPSSSSKHVTTVPSTTTTTCLVRMVVCLWMVGLVTMFLWSICLVPDDDTSRVDWFVPTWKKLQQAAMAEEARQRLEWRHFIQTVLDEMI